MELLEGRDLGDLLDTAASVLARSSSSRSSPSSPARSTRAHERGIVHRDIKPGNLFLCDGGRGEVFVKLLDFGIAKGVDVPLVDSGTKTGAMIGSPFYMSPEQILGSKSLDHRSDLWSLGVVAYEALTGRSPSTPRPMGGARDQDPLRAAAVPSTKVPGLSPAVDAWFHRACARAVTDRFGTAKEMAESLAAALGGEMPRSVDLPRSSTGSNPGPRVASTRRRSPRARPPRPASSRGPGSVRSGNTTRNRVLAVIAFGLALCLGTFGAVSALRKSDTAKSGLVLTADPAPAQTGPERRHPPSHVVEPPPTKLVDPLPADVTPPAMRASSLRRRRRRPPAPVLTASHGGGDFYFFASSLTFGDDGTCAARPHRS